MGLPRYISLPSAFGWPQTTNPAIEQRSFSIHMDIAGNYKLNYPEWNPAGLILLPTKNTYYVAQNGNDSNPGTEGQPFATMDHVLGLNDARHIILKPGLYPSVCRWSTKTPAADCLIEVQNGGRAILGDIERGYTWESTSDSGIYVEQSVSHPASVVAMRFYDEFGVNLSLIEYESHAALVSATSGFYWDGTDLYVKLPDSSEPTGSTCYVLNRGAGAGIVGSPRNQITVRNIDFLGCDNAFVLTSSNTHVVLDGCAFAYSLGRGVIATDAYGGIILRKSRAYANRNDGFSYKNNVTSTPSIGIEDNCQSFNPCFNNLPGADNGSTAHGNCRVLRVGGMYHSADGPVIADINDSKSFNAGCVAFGSNTVNTQPASFAVWDSAEMWLEDCYSYGSTYDLWSDNGAKIHHRNLTSGGNFREKNIGDIDTY